MLAKEIILEYRRDVTVENYGRKVWHRLQKDPMFVQRIPRVIFYEDDSAQHMIAEFMEMVERSDPSPNKQYVQWLVRMYVSGVFGVADDIRSNGADFLKMFHDLKIKRKLPPELSDINRIKKKIQYLKAMRTIREITDSLQPNQTTSRGESREIYKDDEVRVIQPLDKEASCYYGQGSMWCTSATVSDNMFRDYHEAGGIFIVLPLKPARKGEKYQIHLGEDSDEIMDESNSEVSSGEIIAKWPQLYRLFHPMAIKNQSDTVFAVRPEIVRGDAQVKEEIIERALGNIETWLDLIDTVPSIRKVFKMAKNNSTTHDDYSSYAKWVMTQLITDKSNILMVLSYIAIETLDDLNRGNVLMALMDGKRDLAKKAETMGVYGYKGDLPEKHEKVTESLLRYFGMYVSGVAQKYIYSE